jgi:polar amino acid transport system substrate-binding protein
MKHLSFINFAFLLLFTPWVHALSIVAKEEAPYIGKDLPGQGLSVEIVQTALQRAGYKPKFIFENWLRAYEGGQIGVYDVIGSIWKTAKREKDFAFSHPYLFHEVKFIKMKARQDIKFNTLLDLDGLIIGTLKGYAYGDDFLQATHFFKMPNNYLLQSLLLLTQGKVDLALGEVRKIRYELNKFMAGNVNEVEILATPFFSRGTHIAVSKSNPKHQEIISGFNKAFDAMRQDGTYEAILKKHDAQ